MHMMLYLFCLHALLRRSDKVAWWSIAYITALAIAVTITDAANIRYTEMVFVDYRNYAGPDGLSGPIGFMLEEFNAPAEIVSFVFYFISQWLQDGLLLYRFFIIFGSSYLYVAVPVLMFVVTIVLDILLLDQIAQPFANIWQSGSIDIALPAYIISVALNVIITISICLRLLSQRRAMKGSAVGSMYTSLIEMLVESAALYTVFGIGFIITLAINNPIQDIFLAWLPAASGIAPTLIILRVTQRRNGDSTVQASGSRFTSAGTGNTGTAVRSQIQFASNAGLESTNGMEMKGGYNMA
jgi:hypothetical protein